MSQEKSRIAHLPQTLQRNRLLLIGGVVTALPIAAFAPSLLTKGHSHTPLLVAVDEMATATSTNASINEWAVTIVSRGAKPQASQEETDAHQHALSLWQRAEVSVGSNVKATSDTPSPCSLPKGEGSQAQAPEIRWFNGRPVRPARTLSMLVTAYSPDERSCGESADNITASGYSVWTNGMKLVAADTSLLPFGTLVSIPGYDDANIVPVLDKGGAIKGHRLDVLYPTHEQAERWGVKRLDVIVWEYADGAPSDFETQHVLTLDASR